MYRRSSKRRVSNSKLSIIFSITLVCVLSLTVVYAVLNSTLTINGSGRVNAANWGVKIKNSTIVSNRSSGSASYTTPTISGTTIANYTVNLTKPNDQVELFFDVENTGTLNAEIASVVSSTPTCTSATGNTADANLICSNLDISFKYYIGTNYYNVSSGDIINPEDATCLSGNTGANLEYTTLQLSIKLKSSMTSVSSSNVTISNLNHQIIYTQTDKACSGTCFVAGTKVLTGLGRKNIEDIKIGDFVYAVNTVTGRRELRRVTNTISRSSNNIYSIYAGDEIIETTWNHPFYVVDKGWVIASKLDEGDILSSNEIGEVIVEKIVVNNLNSNIPVYNITVDEYHNYLITDSELLVHNAQCPA